MRRVTFHLSAGLLEQQELQITGSAACLGEWQLRHALPMVPVDEHHSHAPSCGLRRYTATVELPVGTPLDYRYVLRNTGRARLERGWEYCWETRDPPAGRSLLVGDGDTRMERDDGVFCSAEPTGTKEPFVRPWLVNRDARLLVECTELQIGPGHPSLPVRPGGPRLPLLELVSSHGLPPCVWVRVVVECEEPAQGGAPATGAPVRLERSWDLPALDAALSLLQTATFRVSDPRRCHVAVEVLERAAAPGSPLGVTSPGTCELHGGAAGAHALPGAAPASAPADCETLLARGVLSAADVCAATSGAHVRVPLLDRRLRHIGHARLCVLAIRPFRSPANTLRLLWSLPPDWRSAGLVDVAHRGCGISSTSAAPQRGGTRIAENTLTSFRTAAKLGATFVEFDVQVRARAGAGCARLYVRSSRPSRC